MTKDKPSPKTALKKQALSPVAALAVMNTLPDPVIAFDSLLKVSFSNKSAQAFFRLKETELLEKFMLELLGNKNAVFQAVEEVVRNNVTMTLQKVSVSGKPVGSVIVAVVEKGLYMMIIRQKPMKPDHEIIDPAMRTFKSPQELAEELKAPMAEIHKAANKLSKSKLNDRDKALSAVILQEATKIQSLLQEFNAFQETPPVPVQNVPVVAQPDPPLPDIRGSFDHQVQAKINMIKNAAQQNSAPPLRVEIVDNGQGIAAEELARIFQSLFAPKTDGGQSLPVASKIVYENGSTINVDSTPGKTVFSINPPVPDPMKK